MEIPKIKPGVEIDIGGKYFICLLKFEDYPIVVDAENPFLYYVNDPYGVKIIGKKPIKGFAKYIIPVLLKYRDQISWIRYTRTSATGRVDEFTYLLNNTKKFKDVVQKLQKSWART